MKALVTGGAGFIGSHLVDQLLEKNIDVIVYDNFYSGSLNNLEKVINDIEVVKADIRDFDTLCQKMRGVDFVFHLAALASVSQSVADPIGTSEINAMGTMNVLWAAHKAGVKRVIISSSCAVYGDSNKPPIKESFITAPKSSYAASKVMSEAFSQSFYHSYGLETVCLRYFNVYGPRQKANSDYAAVIPRFIECYRRKTPPQIYGTGLQSRDFIHVYDVAKANITAAFANQESNNCSYNIGTGKKVNLLELLDVISAQFGYKIEPEFHEARKSDILDSWADCSLAKTEMGFIHSINLADGIKTLL